MAYFYLTFLEATAGGRKKAAEKYNIELKVLQAMGALTSENRGDAATARKLKARKLTAQFVPHTRLEVIWLEEAVKAIIRRVAEIGAGTACAKITMNDLPAL